MEDYENFLLKTYDSAQPEDSHLILIIYDIVDNKRRTRFFKYLSGYLQPVQKSCFETYLSDKKFQSLIQDIPKYIDPEEDNVRAYNLQATGKVYNFGLENKDPLSEIVII